ncbi:hypothetical protein PSTT_14228 [Puccinia striiformis]|uniref:Tc1-like transposase DDE domain-containing protein n=1 Tax=Puccinia striiformis TaxID=27350 RepID=A0A2S4UNC6_9BASI|nr:hypothetical protein PSTT_14228 [Puccinia striiformis]
MAANTSKSSSNNQVVYSAGRSTKGQGNTEENLPSTKKNLTPRSETSTHAAKFTFQTTGPQFPKTPSARFPWSCTLPALGQPASALQYSCFSEAPNTDLVRVHGHIGVSVTGKTWAELIKLCMAYAFLTPIKVVVARMSLEGHNLPHICNTLGHSKGAWAFLGRNTGESIRWHRCSTEYLGSSQHLLVNQLCITLKKAETLNIKKFRYVDDMEYYPAEFFSVYSAVCDQDLLRTLARAPVGSSLARYITNQNPERLSKLPAIGMNGVLALTVRDNTFNTKKFQHFLELGCRVRALCEEAGVRVICLPPYCPELNPIELCFARMKFRLQQMQELSYSLDTHWSIQTTFVDVITPSSVTTSTTIADTTCLFWNFK